jgi:hypothetical protein
MSELAYNVGGCLPYRTSTKSVKRCMGYVEKQMYGPMESRLYFGSIWLKIGMFRSSWWKSPICNFNKICESVYRIHENVNL